MRCTLLQWHRNRKVEKIFPWKIGLNVLDVVRGHRIINISVCVLLTLLIWNTQNDIEKKNMSFAMMHDTECECANAMRMCVLFGIYACVCVCIVHTFLCQLMHTLPYPSLTRKLCKHNCIDFYLFTQTRENLFFFFFLCEQNIIVYEGAKSHEIEVR